MTVPIIFTAFLRVCPNTWLNSTYQSIFYYFLGSFLICILAYASVFLILALLLPKFFFCLISLLPCKFLFWLFSFHKVYFGCTSWRTPLRIFLGLTLLHSRIGAYFSAFFAFSKRRWLKALVLGITEEERIRKKSQELAFDNNTISLESFYLIGYAHQLINVSFLLEIMLASFKSSISVL